VYQCLIDLQYSGCFLEVIDIKIMLISDFYVISKAEEIKLERYKTRYFYQLRTHTF
jgi:hypothetical protein